MATKVIDIGALERTSQSLTTIHGEFSEANSKSDYIAAEVHQKRLKAAVRDFAHKWDDKRAEMVEGIVSFSQVTQEVANAWVGFDQDGADALEGKGD